jgi:hypothetical protein
MLDMYIIYNEDLKILICRICKIGVIEVHRHFARNYQVEISLKNHQKIDEYAENLILRSVKDVLIPIHEIEAIEEIEIIEDFKYTAEFEYQKIYDTPRSIEKYYKSNHDWNISKDNMNILIIDILIK